MIPVIFERGGREQKKQEIQYIQLTPGVFIIYYTRPALHEIPIRDQFQKKHLKDTCFKRFISKC